MRGMQTSHKLTIVRPDLTGRPGGEILAQKPWPKTTIKIPNYTGDLPEPNAAEMAVNFTKAMGKWIAAGVPVVTEAQYAERAAICAGCELWDGKANLGLGKCKAPGCGCTKFKRWLGSEVCKHPAGSKWPALQAPV